MQDNRDGSGRWLKGGPSPNPGGLSRRQRTVVRLIEGLTPKAVRTLGMLLDDPDPHVQLGALKEIIGRVLPPPPRAPTAVVNVAVGTSEAHMAVLEAKARARIAEQEAAVAAIPVPATIVAVEPVGRGELNS
jgi:hypothetical protein